MTTTNTDRWHALAVAGDWSAVGDAVRLLHAAESGEAERVSAMTYVHAAHTEGSVTYRDLAAQSGRSKTDAQRYDLCGELIDVTDADILMWIGGTMPLMTMVRVLGASKVRQAIDAGTSDAGVTDGPKVWRALRQAVTDTADPGEQPEKPRKPRKPQPAPTVADAAAILTAAAERVTDAGSAQGIVSDDDLTRLHAAVAMLARAVAQVRRSDDAKAGTDRTVAGTNGSVVDLTGRRGA